MRSSLGAFQALGLSGCRYTHLIFFCNLNNFENVRNGTLNNYPQMYVTASKTILLITVERSDKDRQSVAKASQRLPPTSSSNDDAADVGDESGGVGDGGRVDVVGCGGRGVSPAEVGGGDLSAVSLGSDE